VSQRVNGEKESGSQKEKVYYPNIGLYYLDLKTKTLKRGRIPNKREKDSLTDIPSGRQGEEIRADKYLGGAGSSKEKIFK